MKNAEQPAYPISKDIIDGCGETTSPFGLTKREYFAAMAMQGILSGNYPALYGNADMAVPEQVAIDSINYADELLKQLEP